MTKNRVTSLDEIRAQAEPDVIEIPGFRAKAKILVAVQSVDLSPHLLSLGIGNPLLEIAKKKAQEGRSREEIEAEMEAEVIRQSDEASSKGFAEYLPIIDAVCKEALVQPTWDEITSIRLLTLAQKMVLFNAATGDSDMLRSFRGQ